MEFSPKKVKQTSNGVLINGGWLVRGESTPGTVGFYGVRGWKKSLLHY
jgi:hypothetical protein